jgi:hypothetical protein
MILSPGVSEDHCWMGITAGPMFQRRLIHCVASNRLLLFIRLTAYTLPPSEQSSQYLDPQYPVAG